MEQWKPIERTAGHYEVSNYGRIRRAIGGKKAIVGRIVKPSINRKGYPQVRLSVKCQKMTTTVHQCVANAFIGPRPPGLEVNHIDGVKRNCNARNLEYVTPSQNMKHAYDHLGWRPKLRRGMERTQSLLTDDQVRRIKRAVRDGMPRGTLGKMAKAFGVKYMTVYNVASGTTWMHVAI